jgi:hypothetical protein
MAAVAVGVVVGDDWIRCRKPSQFGIIIAIAEVVQVANDLLVKSMIPTSIRTSFINL